MVWINVGNLTIEKRTETNKPVTFPLELLNELKSSVQNFEAEQAKEITPMGNFLLIHLWWSETLNRLYEIQKTTKDSP